MAYGDTKKLKRNIRVNLIPNVDIDGTVTVENAERYFLNLIDKTSPADVVEVKHGEWIYKPSSDTLGGTDATYDWMCSVCEDTSVDNTKFCPNCGTKMDGGKRG